MNVEQVIKHLWTAQEFWRPLLVNPQFLRIGDTAAWVGYDPGVGRKIRNTGDFVGLSTSRQYSCKINVDDSLLQLVYAFDEDEKTLLSARLAYYQSPLSLRDEATMDDTWAPDESTSDDESDFIGNPDTVSWIRIDYDPGAHRDVVHTCCHLHVHGFSESRISIDGVPSPKQFIEFVLAVFYPKEYSSKRIGADGRPRPRDIFARINRDGFDIDGRAPRLLRLVRA